MKFKTQWNDAARPNLREFEEVDPISETAEGEALSIKDLMEKALLGMHPDERTVNYFDVKDLDMISDEMRPMTDLTDLDTIRERVEKYKEDLQTFDDALKNAEKNRDDLREQEEVEEAEIVPDDPQIEEGGTT